MLTMRRIASFLRTLLATALGYPLGWPLSGILMAAGVVASVLGFGRGFILRGEVFWGRLVFLFVGRLLRIRGLHNKSPARAYLILANHASFYDIPVILAACPGAAFVGREKLMRIPGFRTFLRAVGYVPIDTGRVKRAHDAIVQAIRRADHGMSIIMFPEGTRTLSGDVQPLKRGFVYVLRESGLDVLPVTIRGTYALKPKFRASLDPRQRIEAVVHAPIANAELTQLSDREIMNRIYCVLKRGSSTSCVHGTGMGGAHGSN